MVVRYATATNIKNSSTKVDVLGLKKQRQCINYSVSLKEKT